MVNVQNAIFHGDMSLYNDIQGRYYHSQWPKSEACY